MLTKGRRLSQTSGVYTHFRNLRDEQLGTVDYRRSARILEQDKVKWIKAIGARNCRRRIADANRYES